MVEPAKNYARFEISGLEVPLPNGWYFHDEGASRLDILIPRSEGPQTIEGKRLEIITRHLTRYYLEVKNMNPADAYATARKSALYDFDCDKQLMDAAQGRRSMSGVCSIFGPLQFGSKEETHIHILYLDLGRKDINLRIRAHEEQHAITHIPGAIEMLEDKIKEERGTPIHFDRITDKELAADCNAVHTLTIKGFDLTDVYEYDLKRDPVVAKRFKRAMYMYDRGDYSSFGFTANQLSSRIKKILRKR